MLQKGAKITYLDAHSKKTTRVIEVHYLILNPPIWYAVCWDQLRRDVRSFRCDRMRQIVLQQEHFEVRPWTEFQHAMEGNPTQKI